MERDYRYEEIARRLGDIESTKPLVLAERLSTLHESVRLLSDEVRTMKRAFYTFALSITASAVLFALTIFLSR